MNQKEFAHAKENPEEPMTFRVFAECLKLWHMRGCPTKKNANPSRARAQAEYQRNYRRAKRETFKSDPYGAVGAE